MKKGFLTLLITACLIMLPSFPANAARLSDKLPLPAVMSLPSALQLSQTASASDNTSMEETYNIWVSNIQITEKNKNNVLRERYYEKDFVCCK